MVVRQARHDTVPDWYVSWVGNGDGRSPSSPRPWPGARRRVRAGPGIRHHEADVADLDGWWDGVAFDGAVCEMAMMDIDDLHGTLRAVATAVRPGGWFVIAMVHPCFPGNESRNDRLAAIDRRVALMNSRPAR
jgi:hypothetical protein